MKIQKKKLSGSYYTPLKTIQFMKKYLENEKCIYKSILEPSAGDGRFIDIFEKKENITELTAIELIEDKVEKLIDNGYQKHVSIIQDDFLNFAEKTNQKYELIIGNPPYINIKNMQDVSKHRAKEFCERYDLSQTLMQNMWVAFLLAAVSCLKKGGIIFFVLPMEFLQVQYAEQVRGFLEKTFNTIHILTFKERMFPEIEQESCLVYLTNEYNSKSYIEFKSYAKLDSKYPNYCSKIQRNKPLKKWTNAILSDKDIDLLNELNFKYKKISEICDASPGIVTGANNEFILSKTEVEELRCEEFTLKIIPKSSILHGELILNQEVINEIDENGSKIYLLNLSKIEEKVFSKELKQYIKEIGEKKNSNNIKLKNRYKCKNRTPWYGVPIVKNGDLFFFKRYDKLPRMCINDANLYTTDIAYNMRLKEEYDKKSIAFCFYNSLTLTQCEFYGRYYAGGVSELIPSEFKKLAIPYFKIKDVDIQILSDMLKKNKNTDEIIKYVNSKTIGTQLPDKTILKLEDMRKRLIARRINID